MSPLAKRTAWGLGLVGVCASATFAAISLVSKDWAVGLLAGFAVLSLAGAAAVFGWGRVRSWLFTLDRHLWDSPGSTENQESHSATDPVLWRRGDAMLRRYDHLSADFTSPRPGVYRMPEEWDARLRLLKEAFGRLELAVEDSPLPHYDQYVAICREIREILGRAVQKPEGKGYYLALSESGVMKRLRELVERDREAEV